MEVPQKTTNSYHMIQQFHSWKYTRQTVIQKDTCAPMFIAVTTKIWKQLKCLSADEWIKMCYLYTMDYYSTIKRMKSCHLQQHGCN